jgi:hypothetical protein
MIDHDAKFDRGADKKPYSLEQQMARNLAERPYPEQSVAQFPQGGLQINQRLASGSAFSVMLRS